MKRIILFAGMAALVSGCASIKYFDDALSTPEEPRAKSGYGGTGRRSEWPYPCMNMTMKDLTAFSGMWEEGGVFAAVFVWPFLAIDVPMSLISDTVSLPWQLARDLDVPFDARRQAVLEMLRGLVADQSPKGCWLDGKSILADTSLVVLALAELGRIAPAELADGGEFARPFARAADYLMSCADVSGGDFWILGEDTDARALPLAACALAAIAEHRRDAATREAVRRCRARLEREGTLRAGAPLATLWIDVCGDCPDAEKRFWASFADGETVKGEDGRYHWRGSVYTGVKNGFAPSGLGRRADNALGLLQYLWHAKEASVK